MGTEGYTAERTAGDLTGALDALSNPFLATPRRSPTQLVLGRQSESRYRRTLALADTLALALALFVGITVLGDARLTPASLVALPVFVVMAKVRGLYDRDEHLLHKTTLDEVPALFGITTVATLLIWLTSDLLVEGPVGRGDVLGIWAVLFVAIVSLRALGRSAARRLAPVERCALIGSPATAEYLREKLSLSHAVKAELVAWIPADNTKNGDRTNGRGFPDELGAMLDARNVDRVILAAGSEGRDELLYMIRELKASGVRVSVLPDPSRVAGSSVELDHLYGATLLGMRRFDVTRSSRFIKRLFDIAGSLAVLILLSPVILLTAIAIKLDSPGPVFFRQRRVGLHGRAFEMLKFRSMETTAEQRKAALQELNQGAAGLFKIPDDPRVTRVGRVIRRWQLDELPQLWNVLLGQMSLVGPRPLIPEEDSQIEGWYRRRLDLPPGMTGHWQVLGSSSRIPLEEMVKLDYLYVANWSLWTDVLLLLRTIPFVISRRGV